MKDRDLSLDVLRVIACCMVVFMHSPMPSANANGPFLVALSYLTAPCIGLFFMVSGALLLPVRTDGISFVRRRLSKIVIPTLLWTAIYIAVKAYFSPSEINLLQAAISVPFSAQGNGVLWFMYTLAGLYLLAPILGAWLQKASVREIEAVLILWATTLCYPLIEPWVAVNRGTTGILYYFSGYAGYFLLGFYLKRHASRVPMALPAAVAGAGFTLLVALKAAGIEFDFYSLFWYESIFIASLCCLAWMAVCRTMDRLRPNPDGVAMRYIVLISNLSFGIYLAHILVMREWLWRMPLIQGIGGYVAQTLLIAAITLILTFALCWLISRTPASAWLIGFTPPPHTHTHANK